VASALVSAGADIAALARVVKKSGADSRKTVLLRWRAAGMGVLIEGRTAKESNPALSVNCRGDIEGRDGCHPLYIFLFPKKLFCRLAKIFFGYRTESWGFVGKRKALCTVLDLGRRSTENEMNISWHLTCHMEYSISTLSSGG